MPVAGGLHAAGTPVCTCGSVGKGRRVVTSCDAVDERAGRLLVNFRLCALGTERYVVGVCPLLGTISPQDVLGTFVSGV